jgi:hypothetical protein
VLYLVGAENVRCGALLSPSVCSSSGGCGLVFIFGVACLLQVCSIVRCKFFGRVEGCLAALRLGMECTILPRAGALAAAAGNATPQ